MARQWVCQVVREGDTAIDATAGNGHDTVWLAEAVGATGKVVAMDIQPAALDAAAGRVAKAGLMKRVEFHDASHELIGQLAAPGTVAVVVFNLGYLPGHNHAVITQARSTLAGLNAAVVALRPGGVISAVCYPGHEGGNEETDLVQQWFFAVGTQGWRVVRYSAIGTLRAPPLLLLAVKP